MSQIIKHVFRPLLTRQIATTPVLNQPRSLVKLKKLQADYQCEDGREIWLKAGFMDRVLYSSTIVLSIAGVAMVFAFLYDQAKPPSWKSDTC